MLTRRSLIKRIKKVHPATFKDLAIDLFHYQYSYNPIYKQYVDYLNVDINKIDELSKIPFLPIQFFKKYKIITSEEEMDWSLDKNVVFESSKTTGQISSKHYIKDPLLYHELALKQFRVYFDDSYAILALLPSYLERNNSSLVSMVQYLIEHSKSENSGFFLDDYHALNHVIQKCQKEEQKILLIGVSFALLDFGEQFKGSADSLCVMETGGMKGRKKELTKLELHEQIKKDFGVSTVYSEYGMTELLSQAYSVGEGRFAHSNTMKIVLKEFNDPFIKERIGQRGIMHIIDLANIDSCAFIATEDIGRIHLDGTFEVLGRLDASEIRGCNLMFDEFKNPT